MSKVVYTNSELTAARCSFRHYVQYHLNLRNNRFYKRRSMNIGQMVHAGIEIMYKTQVRLDELSEDKPLTEALEHVRGLAAIYDQQMVSDPNRIDAVFERDKLRDAGLAEIILELYYHHIYLKERYKVEHPESKFEVPIITPSGRCSTKYMFAGKRDAIVRNINGDNELYLHEVKVKGKWDANDERFMRIDDQTTGYLWASRQEGYNLRGVIYTVLLRSDSRFCLTAEAKKKKRLDSNYAYNPILDYETVDDYIKRVRNNYLSNPDDYIIRRTFTRTDAEIANFQNRLYLKAINCEQVKRMKSPFPEPDAMICPNCQAFEYCAEPTPETVARYYSVKKAKHEELVEEETD